ncbi:MAG: inositol monophosphatase family protein [Thiomonas sp.]|uniref:inositol monophosphatase family protein n=1 Tax=Thiomonas sp. TaxID=2047785 RepID=UPI002A36A752|nr:inositol monophosphatase family protein [Thiomonas sp.]MDY0328874.1 inositol monophosphatase family protein [Thiomonas sp.]
MPSPHAVPELALVSALLRNAARGEILPRAQSPDPRLKADGTWITDADLSMQTRVQRELAALWPHIPLLGEEMTPEVQQRLMAQEAAAPQGPGLWVLDPLDGTSNFSAGLPIFGPSLAWIQGGKVRLGVVVDVMRDEVFSAALGAGALLNGQTLRVPASTPPLAKTIACIDFKRLPAPLAAQLAVHPPYASQRSIGSVALDWCWVAAGRFHLYLHGSQGLWDYAAGSLILSEAGGHGQTLAGEAVFNNTLEKRSAVCAGDAGLFAQWVRWLAAHEAAPR